MRRDSCQWNRNWNSRSNLPVWMCRTRAGSQIGDGRSPRGRGCDWQEFDTRPHAKSSINTNITIQTADRLLSVAAAWRGTATQRERKVKVRFAHDKEWKCHELLQNFREELFHVRAPQAKSHRLNTFTKLNVVSVCCRLIFNSTHAVYSEAFSFSINLHHHSWSSGNERRICKRMVY